MVSYQDKKFLFTGDIEEKRIELLLIFRQLVIVDTDHTASEIGGGENKNSRLQDTFSSVHDGYFILAHKLYATLSSDEFNLKTKTVKL